MSVALIHEVRAEPARLRRTQGKEYGIRFVFGATVASLVGILGKVSGPVVAGLFLAFPSVLPASLTLIESHEGKKPAGTDAFGAAIGSVGLMAFAGVVWAFAPRAPAWIVLGGAALSWLVVSTALWTLSETIVRRLTREHEE